MSKDGKRRGERQYQPKPTDRNNYESTVDQHPTPGHTNFANALENSGNECPLDLSNLNSAAPGYTPEKSSSGSANGSPPSATDENVGATPGDSNGSGETATANTCVAEECDSTSNSSALVEWEQPAYSGDSASTSAAYPWQRPSEFLRPTTSALFEWEQPAYSGNSASTSAAYPTWHHPSTEESDLPTTSAADYWGPPPTIEDDNTDNIDNTDNEYGWQTTSLASEYPANNNNRVKSYDWRSFPTAPEYFKLSKCTAVNKYERAHDWSSKYGSTSGARGPITSGAGGPFTAFGDGGPFTAFGDGGPFTAFGDGNRDRSTQQSTSGFWGGPSTSSFGATPNASGAYCGPDLAGVPPLGYARDATASGSLHDQRVDRTHFWLPPDYGRPGAEMSNVRRRYAARGQRTSTPLGDHQLFQMPVVGAQHHKYRPDRKPRWDGLHETFFTE